MGMKSGKQPGWLCLPPGTLKTAGLILIAAGLLLVIIFVPAKYWMAMLGFLLLAAGIALRFLF